AELAAQAAADYRDVKAGALTNADDALKVRIPLKAGMRTVSATILKSNDVLPEGLGPARIPIWSREGDVPTMPAFISSLLIGGPYNAQMPTDPKDSPSRSRIFVCQPQPTTTNAEETACATKILSTLARRAYRRPSINRCGACSETRGREHHSWKTFSSSGWKPGMSGCSRPMQTSISRGSTTTCGLRS